MEENRKPADDKKFTFDMELNAKDIWVFSMYHSNRSYLGIFNIIFTFVCLYSLIVKWNSLNSGMRLLFIGFVLLFPVIQPFMLYLKAAKQARTTSISKGMKVELSKAGITVSQGEQKAEFEWDKVNKCMIRSAMIIIYLDSIRAYLIPSRYMGEDRAELESLIREKSRVIRF